MKNSFLLGAIALALSSTMAWAQPKQEYNWNKSQQVQSVDLLKAKKFLAAPSGTVPGFPSVVADTSKRGSIYVKITPGKQDTLLFWDSFSAHWIAVASGDTTSRAKLWLDNIFHGNNTFLGDNKQFSVQLTDQANGQATSLYVYPNNISGISQNVSGYSQLFMRPDDIELLNSTGGDIRFKIDKLAGAYIRDDRFHKGLSYYSHPNLAQSNLQIPDRRYVDSLASAQLNGQDADLSSPISGAPFAVAALDGSTFKWGFYQPNWITSQDAYQNRHFNLTAANTIRIGGQTGDYKKLIVDRDGIQAKQADSTRVWIAPDAVRFRNEAGQEGVIALNNSGELEFHTAPGGYKFSGSDIRANHLYLFGPATDPNHAIRKQELDAISNSIALARTNTYAQALALATGSLDKIINIASDEMNGNTPQTWIYYASTGIFKQVVTF